MARRLTLLSGPGPTRGGPALGRPRPSVAPPLGGPAPVEATWRALGSFKTLPALLLSYRFVLSLEGDWR